MSINGPGFNIPDENYTNMLTNQGGGWFGISELEVWEVTFLDEY